MIRYNPKDWFTFIFNAHKSDTIRQLLPMLIAMAIYTTLIVYLVTTFFHISPQSNLKNIITMHNLLGAVISLLLVFRTNTAYDRWWEGRKLWGQLVNHSRSLAIKLAAILSVENKKDRAILRKLLGLYPYILRHHLSTTESEIELFDVDEFNNIIQDLDSKKHLPNQVAYLLTNKIITLYKEKTIDEVQLRILNEELRNYSEVCGACERIHNTPIPYSYSVFLKKFIFIYIMTLPFGLLFTLGYLSIPVVVFIFYVLASLELIAEEIEDPFGTDANDLPMLKICKNIRKHVDEILF
jgi:ion channel-forming bestrophin family protein